MWSARLPSLLPWFGRMKAIVRLAHAPFDPSEELRAFNAETEDVGAIVSFVGLARGNAKDGSPINALVLERYRSVTLRSMEAIADAAHARFEIGYSWVIHRDGRILPGEPIVFVATASAHRRAAFEAADYLIDRLKSEAVFWKWEEGPAGARWIEPTIRDAADLSRWADEHRTDHARN